MSQGIPAISLSRAPGHVPTARCEWGDTKQAYSSQLRDWLNSAAVQSWDKDHIMLTHIYSPQDESDVLSLALYSPTSAQPSHNMTREELRDLMQRFMSTAIIARVLHSSGHESGNITGRDAHPALVMQAVAAGMPVDIVLADTSSGVSVPQSHLRTATIDLKRSRDGAMTMVMTSSGGAKTYTMSAGEHEAQAAIIRSRYDELWQAVADRSTSAPAQGLMSLGPDDRCIATFNPALQSALSADLDRAILMERESRDRALGRGSPRASRDSSERSRGRHQRASRH